jgi:uncharacterized coiled-coil protein SlyX
MIAKKKRMNELKKVLAAQSLQDFTLTEINKQAEVSLQSNQKSQQQLRPYYNSFNFDNNDLKSKYEQEKYKREQVSSINILLTI